MSARRMRFVGVSTASSSIMKVFPLWSDIRITDGMFKLAPWDTVIVACPSFQPNSTDPVMVAAEPGPSINTVPMPPAPSWSDAAPPEVAEPLYDFFVRQASASVAEVATGKFQAMMQVELINDGPVTILLDSKKLF